MKMSASRKIVYLFLTLFFVFAIILPICSMLRRITPEGFSKVFHSAQFLPALKNSFTTAFTATIISLLLAFAGAWCMERTAIPNKSVFRITFILPMLIPSISHAFGLVALFGRNGFFTNLFGIDSGIYGFWGIVIGSVMYAFPGAFIMFSEILHYEDGTPYQAASVLGVSPFHQFIDITLPYLKKTILSAFFATFTLIITDYGVPLLIGGKMTTLSVLMYNKAVSMMDYDSGSVIGLLLLLPAFAAFIIDLLNPTTAQNNFISEKREQSHNRTGKITAELFCGLITLCVISPIAAFIFMFLETKYPIIPSFTLTHIQKTINRGALNYLWNSVLFAVLSALLGVFIAFVCAYLTTRMKDRFSRNLHLISMTSMAIPGLVLGLSYVMFFHDSSIYGTLFIIVLVNSVHFFASPYLMMYNSLLKVNPNLEAVGAGLGISRLRIILDVIVPKVRNTLFEMFGSFFINSMMTISAVSFLAPPAPKPVSLMINQFEAQLLMESAAFVSLLIFLINFSLKLLINRNKTGKPAAE